MLDIIELEELREPILETRELNRARGEKMEQEIEDDCNAKLCKLNLAIQGIEPYEPEPALEAKPKTTRKRGKVDEDVLS